MAFDAFFMSAVVGELRELEDVRVEKIYQTARDTLILLLKHRQGRSRLLFAANPAAPRLHLTDLRAENPAEPPMFCMLLRKHLTGARLAELEQPPMERCLLLHFDCIDELGDRVRKTLVAELMGRTCNLYLLSPEGRIIDCLRRVGLDESARRQALPGLYYQPPEPVEKKNPAKLELEDYVNLLEAPGPDLLADRLMQELGGLSPLVCREAALAAAGDVDARLSGADIPGVAQGLLDFFRRWIGQPEPWYSEHKNQYAFCPIRQYGESRRAESFSALLDLVYGDRERQTALRQRSQGLRKTVQNLQNRLERKLKIQEQELAATYDRERLRQLGDIVTANLHRIRRGQTMLRAEDFYDEEMPVIEIPLSPSISPQANAAKFYKDYTRMKNAEKELSRQLELGRRERDYLQSVLEELNRADSDQMIEEIRQELQAGGYIRSDSGKKRMKLPRSAPMRFESTDGTPIFVGRNNRQNEELTFRQARKDDLWLHAQRVHGSHVVIACGGGPVSDDTVTQAAQLAAYYAETSGGQNIPVDVTPVKQVKKLPGGKLGMVIYHSYRTVVVNPYPDIREDPLNSQKP